MIGSSIHQFIMNIIIWNCRGALKPTFHSHVRELVRVHDPTILVLMKPKLEVIRQERFRVGSRLMKLFILKPLVMLVGYGCFGTLIGWRSLC